jgi:hypothetical protein
MGEERDNPGKGGVASPHVFSALSYNDRWIIYSDTTPCNLGASTLFHGLLEIASRHWLCQRTSLHCSGQTPGFAFVVAEWELP